MYINLSQMYINLIDNNNRNKYFVAALTSQRFIVAAIDKRNISNQSPKYKTGKECFKWKIIAFK